MTVRANQPSFAAGEWAPALRQRVDLQKYASALETAKNGTIHPQGGFSNRAGTKFIASTKDASKKALLVEFVFSTEQAYMLEFGEEYARFFKDGGQIEISAPAAWASPVAYVVGDFVAQGGTNYYCIVAHTSVTFSTDLAAGKWVAQDVYEVPTGYAEADLADLKFTQSADTLFVFHKDHMTQMLTRTDHDAWTVSDYDPDDGPFLLANGDTTKKIEFITPTWVTATLYTIGDSVENGTAVYNCLTTHTSGVFATDLSGGRWYQTGSIVIGSGNLTTAGSPSAHTPFNALHVGALWELRHAVDAQAWSGTINTPATATPSIACGSSWRIETAGTWTGLVAVEKSVDGGLTWTPIASFEANVDASGDTGETKCLIRVVRPTAANYFKYSTISPPSQTGTVTGTLKADQFTWISVFRVTGYTSGSTVTAIPVGPAPVGTVRTVGMAVGRYPAKGSFSTASWAEGAWSDYRGYPRVGVFHEDRLFSAASVNDPASIWGSQTSVYDSHAVSSPLLDSDAIAVNLPSRRVNIIKDLVPLQDILIRTSAEDFFMAASGGPLSPTTVELRRIGNRGSNGIAAEVIGQRAVGILPRSQAVADFGFNLDADGYQGTIISVFASHLLNQFTITSLAYQKEPDSILWFVRSDGKLLSLTYMPEQEVFAWCWHETDGAYESVASIPGTTYDEVWVIVKRTVDGSTVRYVELLQERLASTEPQDQFFVDSGLSLDTPLAIEGITKADPGVVTITGHGLSNGDVVDLSDIVGMVELNGYRAVVANKGTNTFELTNELGDDIDTSDFTAYASGGEARLAVAAVSGLDHLEGKTVAILANGSVQPQKVVTAGAVTISPKASRVHVGLPYQSKLKTLRPDFPLQDGTLSGRKVRIPEAIVWVLNSVGCKVGVGDGDTLETLIKRSGNEDPLSPIPLKTGSYKVKLAGGFESGGQISIVQDDPLPMTITGIVPVVQIGK